MFDPETFPYAIPRPYTPKAAQINEYPVSVTGCKNIVIVHASMQGESPAPLVDTLEKQKDLPGYTLRGLATINVDKVSDEELDKLHAAGVRGARLHRMAWGHGHQSGAAEVKAEVEALAKRLERLGWVIDIFTEMKTWAALADTVRAYPKIKWVGDHFGGTFPGDEKSPEFPQFLELIREKRLWVKLSGFERLYDGHKEGIEVLTPIAKPIIEAGPTQIIYGSDWRKYSFHLNTSWNVYPNLNATDVALLSWSCNRVLLSGHQLTCIQAHTQLGLARKGKTAQQRIDEVEGFREVDDIGHIKKLREWIPDDGTWKKFWAENCEVLFR